jgi:NAD-dependent SIR2 family protein deacetylase
MLLRSKNCVAYTGAGISTSSGISDYATKARDSIATSSTGGAKTSPWAARPTPAHRVLVGMHQRGILKHWVQQNHDGLPQKAGYPQTELNEIHGAWFDPSNPVVPMDGTLREDLIKWLLEWEEKVDLCLALGTSMVGMNADRIPVAAAQRAKKGNGIGMVIVALQETQYDIDSSLRIFAPIDEVLTRLVVELELEVAAASSCVAADKEQIFENLPYDETGALNSGAKLSLDLREGSKVRIVNQPAWDKAKWGPMGVVIQAQTSLQEEGHIAIRMGEGEGGVIRVLGRWWLEDARRGKVPHLPVVPWR